MKKNYTLWKRLIVVFLLLLGGSGVLTVAAQGYVHNSRTINLAGADISNALVTDEAGNSYQLMATTANNFAVTTGAAPTGTARKALLIKMNIDGDIVWARYMPQGTPNTTSLEYRKMEYRNGMLYLLGTTTATNIVTTNGSVGAGGGSDAIYARVDASNGAVVNTAYLGGSGVENAGLDMKVSNGNVYVTYTTTSTDIETTNGSSFTGSGFDQVVQRLDASGAMIYTSYTGRSATATEAVLAADNSNAYLVRVIAADNNFATTNGSAVKGASDYGVIKLDNSGNPVYRLLYGGAADESIPVVAARSGELFLYGASTSADYPVTDGSSFAGSPILHVLTKFGANGEVIYSSHQAGVAAGTDNPCMVYDNGSLYMITSGFLSEPRVNVTDGTTGGAYLIKIDAHNGSTLFATRFFTVRNFLNSSGSQLAVDNDKVYIAIPTLNVANGVTTDGSTRLANSSSYIAAFTTTGRFVFGTYRFTGASTPNGGTANHLAARNNVLYVSGALTSAGATVTIPQTVVGNTSANSADVSLMQFRFCPPMPTENTVGPLTQTVCAEGFTQLLTGNKVAASSDQFPVLYRNGAAIYQMEIPARYQWQVSDNPTGPWTNIPGLGTQKDYTPSAGAASRYYRRVVLPPLGCGDDPVSTSDVAAVIVSADQAPAIASDVYSTCIGTEITIAANVTGGEAPYTYDWQTGLGTTSSINVTPTASSVYSVVVTDNKGCQQVGQAIVNAYTADAGPATTASCGGKPVRIGTLPPAGLAGVTYSWSPATGLDDPTVAQPLASPTVNTVYTLSMTVPVSGGGTCTTTDQITVSVVDPPVVPDFAGADQAVCKGGTLTLGSANETGFTFTWAPGNYLTSISASTTTFNAGSELPNPNSFTYQLTATKGQCAFVDEVVVSVLAVDAGENYCGPRTVGTPDLIPNVTGKIYLWEKVSGPGTITGPTNQAMTTVSASVGAPTTYRLSVSYLGVTCSDEVVVGDCGAEPGCPIVRIDVEAEQGCPSTAFGEVTLRAVPRGLPANRWTYAWSASPAGGISATTGETISLTDGIERDITLTITNVDNPAISCSEVIHVNGPAWSRPIFSAQDFSVCAATPVSIGATAVAGYSYLWNGAGSAQQTVSNPTVTPTQTTSYFVTVTDDLSGCTTKDTATVTIKPIVNNPGNDWTSCSAAVIQLGSPALAGYTYSWTPAAAAYQNGTSAASAEPQVLVAVSQDFTLTVTDTETGCTKDSTVHIIIDESPVLPAMTDRTICLGSSTEIGLPALPGVTYSWSPATGLSSTAVAQPEANPVATTTYTVVATYHDAGGAVACTKTGSVTVIVNAPQITMSDDVVCPSASLYNLGTGVTVTGATTYEWSPIALVTTPTSLTSTVRSNPTVPTTYTLTARDANGCSATASKTLTPTIVAPKAGSNAVVCVGSSIILGDPSNAGTVTWTVAPAISAGSLSSTTATQPVFTPAAADAAKSFTFTISQTIAGCTSTSSVIINTRQLTLPSMAVQTVCANASATIGVTPVQNISYSWSPATGLANPFAATTTINQVTGNMTYTLTATDLNGCFATSQAVVGASATPAPAVSIPSITIPIGATPPAFQPQVNPGAGNYTYSWTPSTKVNNPYMANATPLSSGIGTTTYTLTVTNDQGCYSTAQVNFTVTPVITLPITLERFDAQQVPCAVDLAWEIAHAENFSHFDIERSADGITFEKIGRAGFNSSVRTYRFRDDKAGAGKWFYRLKMTDRDDAHRYSDVVSQQVACDRTTPLKVYPNPVQGLVNIVSATPVESVRVISLSGAIVMRKDFKQQTAAPIQLTFNRPLVKGIYLLQVITKDGKSESVRLLKD
jgi:hypothetical protein